MTSQLQPKLSTTVDAKQSKDIGNFHQFESFKTALYQLLKAVVMLAGLAGAGLALRYFFAMFGGVGSGESSVSSEKNTLEKGIVPQQLDELPVLSTAIRPPVEVGLNRMARVQDTGEVRQREAVALSVPTPASSFNKPIVAVGSIEIGRLDTDGDARWITLNSDATLAFVADYDKGLKIINVANPSAPTLIGSLDTDGYAWGVTLNSDATLAFVADGGGGLKIINVANPSAPTLIGSLVTDGYAWRVTLNSDATLAFVADRDKGLNIINITNSSAPTLIGSLAADESTYGVTLNSDATLAFVVEAAAMFSNGKLKIINVTNSSAPTLMGSLATANAMEVRLNSDATLAFVADRSAGLKIINVTNSSAPIIIGSLVTDNALGVILNSDATLVFVADNYAGLKIINVANPSAPTLMGSLATANAYAVTLNSEAMLAFVAAGGGGLKIVRVWTFYSLPPLTHWYLKGSLDTDGYAWRVTLNSDATLAFVADGYAGLKIINATNPSAPTLLGSLDTTYDAIGVTLNSEATLAFVADISASAGLNIINITNPSAPTLLGSLDTANAYAVTLNSEATLVFVADGYAGLKIINVANPSAPALIGSLYMDGYSAQSVTLNSDATLAFMANGGTGLKIINVANPSVPTLMGSLVTDSAMEVTLNSEATLAFVVDGGGGLKIINVANPSAPTLIGSLVTDGYAYRVTLNSDATLAFVADGDKGLKVFQLGGGYFSAPIVFSGDIMNSKAILKVGIPNNGKVFFFNQNGAEATLSAADFSAINQVIPPGEQDVPPSWFSFSKTTQKFSAIPPKEWTGQRLIINTQITDGTIVDQVWSYFYIEPSLIIDTNSPKLSIQSPASMASLAMQLSNPQAGQFVLQPFGAVSLSFDSALGRLDGIGTITAINKMFQKLRFSLSSPSFVNTTVDITVDDTVNVPQSATVPLSKFGVNRPPSSITPSPLEVKATVPFQYPLNRTAFLDPDADPVAISIVSIHNATGAVINKPSWLNFNSDTWTFSSDGAPVSTIGNVYNITLRISDSLLLVDTQWILKIRQNQAPVLTRSFGQQEALTNEPYRFQIPTDLFNDPNNDTLIYSAVEQGKTALPGWLEFDPETRVFSGKPAVENLGKYAIDITATDDLGNSTRANVNLEVKRSVLDTLAYISEIAGPIITGLGVAYAVYEKYPDLWNAFARSWYHWKELPFEFLDGQPYTPQQKNGEAIPADLIKKVKLVQTTELEGTKKKLKGLIPSGVWHGLTHEPVPAAEDTLPNWLTYNHETNKLRFLRDLIPDDIRGKYTLKVLGDGGKILQQMDLDLAKILAYAAGIAAATLAIPDTHSDRDSAVGERGVLHRAASKFEHTVGGMMVKMEEMMNRPVPKAEEGAVAEGAKKVEDAAVPLLEEGILRRLHRMRSPDDNFL